MCLGIRLWLIPLVTMDRRRLGLLWQLGGRCRIHAMRCSGANEYRMSSHEGHKARALSTKPYPP